MSRPNKPSRPTGIAVSRDGGPFELWPETYSSNNEELEIQWAHKLMAALDFAFGEKLSFVGRGAEPADILLKNEAGDEVQVQIAEAVNSVAIENAVLRERLSRIIWTPDVCSKLDGLEVEIHDGSTIREPVKAGSLALEEIAGSLVEWLCGTATKLRSRPMRLPVKHELSLKGSSLHLSVRRYEPAGAGHGVRYIWSSSGVGGGLPDFFAPVLRKKLEKHYSKPQGTFWLLIYSVDALLSRSEEGRMLQLLQSYPNPFDRVVALMDGTPVQIFPVRDNSAVLQDNNPALVLHAFDLDNIDKGRRWVYPGSQPHVGGRYSVATSSSDPTVVISRIVLTPAGPGLGQTPETPETPT